MRFSVLAITALAALVQSQSLSDLPACAQTCVGNGLTTETNCNGLQIKCICQSTGWIGKLSCCVAKDCNADEQQKTIKFASDLCATQGVKVPNNATEACAAVSGASNSTSSNATSTSSASSSSSSATTAAATAKASGLANKQYVGTGLGLAAAGLFAAML